MDMLFPKVASDVDPLEIYAADSRMPKADRPWLMLNMITSVDGATDVVGTSGGLSGPGDKAVFAAIRSVADIILIGAETLRSENYGPPEINSAALAHRANRNQQPKPRLAIVSGSLDLDLTTDVFNSKPPPLLFTVAEPLPDRLAQACEVAEVHRLGVERVHLAEVVGRLSDLGAGVVLAEGGPRLNGQLLAMNMPDELCWTVAPLLIGGDSARLTSGGPARLDRLRLERVLIQDHYLFLKYCS
ncbi:MAG: pyrimidine reductase family protein [Acidimicrobiia bacterium]|nr:pyrimidine reductase family protein [Acidimicrobiia bacterium]MYC58180.1 pyrimidine reductase family protein [Acidimicrobiia bacterium]MYG94333.1 pyrimidine reductase family protein [Acidimicrobiia bacterium]MYI30612.1 pyrimidine reductase family protein [Acidimicrobiia bacterium]